MRGRLARIFWLGLKEILSLRRDVAMSLLLVWAFIIRMAGPISLSPAFCNAARS